MKSMNRRVSLRVQSLIALLLRTYVREAPSTLDRTKLIRYITEMFKPAIQAKLDRMTVLNAVIEAQEDAPETVCAEYRKLQNELVPVFLPIIRRLSTAGLLSVSVNIEGESRIQRFATADGQARDAFENGNIWIAAECIGGSLK